MSGARRYRQVLREEVVRFGRYHLCVQSLWVCPACRGPRVTPRRYHLGGAQRPIARNHWTQSPRDRRVGAGLPRVKGQLARCPPGCTSRACLGRIPKSDRGLGRSDPVTWAPLGALGVPLASRLVSRGDLGPYHSFPGAPLRRGVRPGSPLTAAPFPARWLAGPGSELVPAPNPYLPQAMALSGPTAPSWEEDECLDYYGMLSLHRMFEVVGGQLTECELELLAFLLDEAPGAAGGLARARSGLELLLELERRGQCDESNLRLLGQLLRVLARHDLLPHLARKRRRPGTCDGG